MESIIPVILLFDESDDEYEVSQSSCALRSIVENPGNRSRTSFIKTKIYTLHVCN